MTVQNIVTPGYPQNILPTQPLSRSGALSVAGSAAKSGSQGVSFADVLKTKVEGLKFSAHAASRMSSRNIGMTPEMMNKLEKAVSGAAVKGARDSLVLMKNCAFIVNIPNRTVVTAMDGESMKDNIFTNIDSAVIAD
jgi:flagellar operon protein